MKNLSSEFIDLENPLCLYCKSICVENNNTNYKVCTFYCEKCNEKVYYPIFGLSLGFTCMDLICSLDFVKQTISISKLNLIIYATSANKFITNTIPIFDINFSDKEKLNAKLNTYLSFS